ncbi:CASTOR/POLLUX-related putative ion channel [Oscillatoria salina]|uniref:CASTOR/POLLUX-related putative ion channel n=1 Tax=Oscillatoria salina TaxID=331517 RepID=UPI0013B68A25|nr:hypothetical protein [Oscillatoria salina]MBZ8179897.1 hypothetical protein [Oscillatoria salina IIICB1]NET87444.1 hypothetical protein [Kamptonema sp. SIO1D9]
MDSQDNLSLKKRLRYQFDNFMSQGGFAVFLALLSAFFAAFVLMTLVRYMVELIFPNEGSPDILWEVFVQLIGLRDVGDDANFAAKIVGVFAIFIGLIFFSSLVAFVTQTFEEQLLMLRKGKSIVVEKDHTLILGFTDRISDIIEELIVANESEEDAVIVILAEEDKEVMDDFFRNNIADFKTTRLVTRNGSVTNLKNLKKVGVNDAKSVIILNEAKGADLEDFKSLSDSRVVKAILAVVAANEEVKLPSIVVEIHSEQYRRLAETIAPGVVTTLNEADILARILVQTSRNVGLATVYLNLVGFEGNEFYFYRPTLGWKNISFSKLQFHLPGTIPLGVRQIDGSLMLNPPKDYVLANNDEAIVLAEDDSAIEFYPEPTVQPREIGYQDELKVAERKMEKYLLIGWNNKTAIALGEYAKYVIPGSQVNLVVRDLTDEIKAKFDQIAKAYPDVNLQVKEVNVDSIEQLKTLCPYEFDSIAILAGSGKKAEEIDAKTLTILLELRQIFREYTAQTANKVMTDLIAEIINTEDTDLVVKAGVKDFLLSNQFVSKILAQVSQEPDVMSIYLDLFSADGSELYIKPISLYFPEEVVRQVTFADCVLAAQSRDEICLGVRINSEIGIREKNYGINLLPKLDRRLFLSLDDALITLAEDEG